MAKKEASDQFYWHPGASGPLPLPTVSKTAGSGKKTDNKKEKVQSVSITTVVSSLPFSKQKIGWGHLAVKNTDTSLWARLFYATDTYVDPQTTTTRLMSVKMKALEVEEKLLDAIFVPAGEFISALYPVINPVENDGGYRLYWARTREDLSIDRVAGRFNENFLPIQTFPFTDDDS